MSDSNIIDSSEIKNYLLDLQERICKSLEQIDQQKQFSEDLWQHIHGGGGRTRILTDGNCFEKVGVNFSHIYGKQLPKTISTQRPELADHSFQAMGVSIVAHPLNPYVPTSHCNVRFFIAEKEDQEAVWWFGGGYDLTPYYGFLEDCVHWHRTAKMACDQIDTQFYDRFKKTADDYFFIRHRHEARGIGGIFFDYFNTLPLKQSFLLMKNVGDSFLQAYLPIVERRKNCPYGERQREFQCYRRGRYVEFNLVYDRGTLFGLQSGGRTESILMSLPPQVSWRYNWQPTAGSEEARLYSEFLPPRNWIE